MGRPALSEIGQSTAVDPDDKEAVVAPGSRGEG